MACGPKCPCQCQSAKPRRRRRGAAAPRHSPVHDLLSALLIKKLQEPINKPAVYKPEMKSMGTSTELEGGQRLGSAVKAEPIQTQTDQVRERVLPLLKEPEDDTSSVRSDIGSVLSDIGSVSSFSTMASEIGSVAGSDQVRERILPLLKQPEDDTGSVRSDPGSVAESEVKMKSVMPWQLKSREQQLSEARTMSARRGKKKDLGPLGNIVAALQAIPEQQAGSSESVDFA